MAMDKGVHIRIDNELRSAFRAYSEDAGVSQSDLVRAFMAAIAWAGQAPVVINIKREEVLCER